MNKKYSELAELFRSEKTDEEILDFLLNYHKNDIADMMAGMTEEERKRLYHLLGAQKVAEIFKYIEEPRKYIRELSVESAARVISEMDSDDAVELLEDLDPEEKEQIVRMLDEDAERLAVRRMVRQTQKEQQISNKGKRKNQGRDVR